jgi:hypothetical protein
MATAAPHVKLLRQLASAKDDYLSGAFDISWDGAKATLYLVFGRPSHAVFDTDQAQIEGEAAIDALLAELPRTFAVSDWRRAMSPQETLSISIDELAGPFVRLAGSYADDPVSEESPEWWTADDSSPDLAFGLADFPLLPGGRPLWAETSPENVNLAERLAELPPSILILTGAKLRAAAVVSGGDLIDAVWIDDEDQARGEAAGMAILGATKGTLAGYALDDPRVAEALTMLWRLPVAVNGIEMSWLDPASMLAAFRADGLDRVLVIDAPVRGIALFSRGGLVAVYSETQRSAVASPERLRSLLSQARGRLTVMERKPRPVAAAAPVAPSATDFFGVLVPEEPAEAAMSNGPETHPEVESPAAEVETADAEGVVESSAEVDTHDAVETSAASDTVAVAEPSVSIDTDAVAAEPSAPSEADTVAAEPSAPIDTDTAAGKPSAPSDADTVAAEPSAPIDTDTFTATATADTWTAPSETTTSESETETDTDAGAEAAPDATASDEPPPPPPPDAEHEPLAVDLNIAASAEDAPPPQEADIAASVEHSPPPPAPDALAEPEVTPKRPWWAFGSKKKKKDKAASSASATPAPTPETIAAAAAAAHEAEDAAEFAGWSVRQQNPESQPAWLRPREHAEASDDVPTGTEPPAAAEAVADRPEGETAEAAPVADAEQPAAPASTWSVVEPGTTTLRAVSWPSTPTTPDDAATHDANDDESSAAPQTETAAAQGWSARDVLADSVGWYQPSEPAHHEDGAEAAADEPHADDAETAHDDSGEAAHDESGEAAHDVRGEAAHDDSGEAAHDDSGEAAHDDSGEAAQAGTDEAQHEADGDPEVAAEVNHSVSTWFQPEHVAASDSELAATVGDDPADETEHDASAASEPTHDFWAEFASPDPDADADTGTTAETEPGAHAGTTAESDPGVDSGTTSESAPDGSETGAEAESEREPAVVDHSDLFARKPSERTSAPWSWPLAEAEVAPALEPHPSTPAPVDETPEPATTSAQSPAEPDDWEPVFEGPGDQSFFQRDEPVGSQFVDFDEVRTELVQIGIVWLGEANAVPVTALLRKTRSTIDDFVATIDTIRGLHLEGQDPASVQAMAREMHQQAAERLCGA